MGKVDTAGMRAQLGPSVRRIASDKELRGHAANAIASAQRVRARLRDGDVPRRLIDDEELHAELGRLVTEARQAVARIQSPPRRQRMRGMLLVAGLAGAAAGAFVLSRRRGRDTTLSQPAEPAGV